MIQTIVSLFRALIALIFIGSLLLSVLMIGTNGLGVILGLAMIVAIVLTIGISATLLSINDHLAALRPRPDADFMPVGSALTPKQVAIGIAVLAALLVVALVVSPNNSVDDVESAAPITTLREGSSIKDGCVPELARKVGLKCRE